MELAPTLILNLVLLVVPPAVLVLVLVQLAATGTEAFRIYYKQRKD